MYVFEVETRFCPSVAVGIPGFVTTLSGNHVVFITSRSTRSSQSDETGHLISKDDNKRNSERACLTHEPLEMDGLVGEDQVQVIKFGYQLGEFGGPD